VDIDILKKYGSLDIIEFDYLRFKSNNNGLSNKTKYIQEQLYILSKY
jgi:adenine-specific DNA-methyltransferase